MAAASPNQTACDLGFYQPSAGQSDCRPARAGWFVPAVASIAATPCSAGTFQPDGGRADCNDAWQGRFVPDTAATAQQKCSPGSYQPEAASVTCLIPEEGSVAPVAGAIRVLACPQHFTSNEDFTICFEIRRLGTFMWALFGFLGIGLAIAAANKAKTDTGGWDDAPWRR